MTRHEPPTILSTEKRPRRFLFLLFFFAFLSLFLSLLLIFIIFLPLAVERQIGKMLERFSERGEFSLQVKHIDLYRAEFSLLADERASSAQSTPAALQVISGRISYRPLRLLRGCLDSIELDAVKLTLDLRQGKMAVPLLQLLPPQRQNDNMGKSEILLAERIAALPVQFSQVRLAGDLILLLDDETIVVEAKILVQPAQEFWDYSLELSHSLNRFCLRGDCDTSSGQLAGELQFDLQTAALPQSIRLKLAESLTAQVSGQGNFTFDPDKLQLLSLQAELRSSLNYRHGDLFLFGQPSISVGMEEGKIIGRGHALQMQIADINIALRQIELCLQQDKLSEMHGKVSVEIEEQNLLEGIFQIGQEGDKKIFSASVQPPTEQQKMVFSLGGGEFSVENPCLALSGRLGDALHYQLSATAEKSYFSSGAVQGSSAAAAITVTGQGSAADMQATLQGLSVRSNDMLCEIAELRYQGSLQEGIMQGKCQLAKGVAKFEKAALEANFAADVPLQWPLQEKGAAAGGSLQVSSLLIKGEHLGQINSKLRLAKKEIELLANGNLRGIEAQIKASCFPFAKTQEKFLAAQLTLPEQEIPENLPPASLVPQLKGFTYNGKVSGGGNLLLRKNAVLGGDAFIKVSDVQLHNDEKNFHLDGLRFECKLPELPKMASSGNQTLAFRNLVFGKFAIKSGRLRFRMESPSSWHLESLTMHWCDGKLKLDSTRINPENKRTSLVFHCDRMLLADLLQQLGVGMDKGEGRVSGSIPIVISGDGLRFRDAFLYSTPGEDGTIKLIASQSIKATAAASEQLAFTLDALANFKYSWVKLALNSEKEMLKVKLQTDGRPLSKLYYVPKDGTLVRSEVANDFTGLGLDANLSIPLNNTLHIYQDFKHLFAP